MCTSNEQCILNSHCFEILRQVPCEPEGVHQPVLLRDIYVCKLYVCVCVCVCVYIYIYIGIQDNYIEGRDGVVSVATSYRLGGSEFETKWVQGYPERPWGLESAITPGVKMAGPLP